MRLWMVMIVGWAFGCPAGAATFVVNGGADIAPSGDNNPGDGICEDIRGGSRCTLRAAIEESNARAGRDTIAFSISGTILILDLPLPQITDDVVLDGRTAPGYVSFDDISDSLPRVFVDGVVTGTAADGLVFSAAAASGSEVRALGVVRFSGAGIRIGGAVGNVLVDGSYIGLQATGEPGGNGTGLLVEGTANRIGHAGAAGAGSGLGNVISANTGDGVRVASGNLVRGNRIGTLATGGSDRGNGAYGVSAFGDDNLIGDLKAGAGNTISYNDGGGVRLAGNGNRLHGNNIGGSIDGTAGNLGYGVLVEGGLNRIGDELGQFPNRIHGSALAGVRLGTPANNGDLNDVSRNTIRDNFGHGVHVSHGEANSVERNNVVANVGDGIRIEPGAARAVVAGNHVGLRFTGAGVLLAEGNGGAGVRLGAERARIHDNLIGNNSGDGIAVMSSGFDSALTGNFIGITDGYVAAGNALAGIRVAGSEIRIGSGVPTELPNVIGSNGEAGIILTGNDNYVVFNHIGISPEGDDIGNGDAGVRISGPGGNGCAVAYNTIGFNSGDAIAMSTSAGLGNQFPLNVMLANEGYGIDLGDDGPTANDSGDADEGPNRTMNHPDIESVTTLPGDRIEVLLRMDASPSNQAYPIQLFFFLADGSGRRQSTHFLGTTPLLEPSVSTFTQVLDLPPGMIGGELLAAATDELLNSSELSPGFAFGREDRLFADGFEALLP